MRAVVILTAAMMVLEICVGYWTKSMALLADGWHMATHVGALGIASFAYAFARRFASHRAFVLGTGKVHALAAYTSALALGLVAVAMMVESIARLVRPTPIDFASSLPVAALGLVVNLLSIRLLHVHDEEEEEEEDGRGAHVHDHNHRAAFMHVVADALTSALAIAALLGGRVLGLAWLDPVTGVVGGLVILRWGFDLCRSAACELLDVDAVPDLEQRIRAALEAVDDARVSDLHVWSLGRGLRICIVTVISSTPREVSAYRKRILAVCDVAHLTVEVRRCTEGHHAAAQGVNAAQSSSC